jgi:hypothetical protein
VNEIDFQKIDDSKIPWLKRTHFYGNDSFKVPTLPWNYEVWINEFPMNW